MRNQDIAVGLTLDPCGLIAPPALAPRRAHGVAVGFRPPLGKPWHITVGLGLERRRPGRVGFDIGTRFGLDTRRLRGIATGCGHAGIRFATTFAAATSTVAAAAFGVVHRRGDDTVFGYGVIASARRPTLDRGVGCAR